MTMRSMDVKTWKRERERELFIDEEDEGDLPFVCLEI